jgi:lactobin A/cerein 7B family class IIb bacteriocin
MNEFSAVSAEELKHVDGGIVPIIAGGVILLAGCIGSTDDIEDREPLPGFNDFLARTKEIAAGGR